MEFGQIGVILTLAAALATLVSLGLETAVFRGYLERADDPLLQARFVNTLGYFGGLTPVLLGLAISAAAAPFIEQVFGVPPFAFVLGCLAAALNVSATVVPMAVLRAQERLRDYLGLTWIQIGVNAGLSVLFVGGLGWGVYGWMAANVLSAALLLSRGLLTLRHAWNTEIDRKSLVGALSFGLPLVPHAAGHWGLAVSDRAVLGAFLSASIVGNYYVAYLLALPVTLVGVALSQATQPLHSQAGRSERNLHELGEVITMQAVGVVLAGGVVAALGPPLAQLVLPAEYGQVGTFLPWLAAGACLFGLYLVPMNAVTIMVGRTGTFG